MARYGTSFDAEEHLGDQGWSKGGADKYPPIVARGVLIDLAKSMGVQHLPASYGITSGDLQTALREQGTQLQAGRRRAVPHRAHDLVAPIRPGTRLATRPVSHWKPPGGWWTTTRPCFSAPTISASRAFRPRTPTNYVPVHTFLFAERGVSVIEVMWLEDLARDEVYEFLFIAAPLKLRGATGSPLRPVAIPTQR